MNSDMTGKSEKCSDDVRHESILLSLMESSISECSKLVGLNRFGAVLDLYRSATLTNQGSPALLKTGQSEEEIPLKKKIQILKKNGCFAIYQSKVIERQRRVTRSKICSTGDLT